MTALGTTIRHTRSNLGMSLQDVADRAGITKSHVHELERGRARNPRLSTILGLAFALELNPADLCATALASAPDVRSILKEIET